MPLELCFPGVFDYNIQIKIKNLVLRQLADTYVQKYWLRKINEIKK